MRQFVIYLIVLYKTVGDTRLVLKVLRLLYKSTTTVVKNELNLQNSPLK